jgi:anti-anti-sigma regulatory factor
MNISITKTERPASVTILHLEGKLDGANYENLIDEAQEVYDAGVRDLILDLSKLTFISSAGMAALHQVALLFRGEKHPGQDDGWAAYHSIDRDRGRGTQEHVKLFSPSEPVRQVLDMTGFSSLFEIFTDLHLAITSFRQAAPAMAARLS